MKTYIIHAFILAVLFLVPFSSQAQAGVVYGQSSVGYNSTSRQVFGYSATWTDYELSFYYDPAVGGGLYWMYDNEVPLDSGYSVGFSDPYWGYQIPGEVFLFSSRYQPITTYSTFSNHFLKPYFVDDFGYFYDPFQYFFAPGGGFGGYYGLFGYGFNPYNYISFQEIYVFTTGVSITTPSDVCRIPGTNFDENGRPCNNQVLPTPTPPSTLTVTIQPITAVPKNGTVTVQVEVAPANNQTPITLSLETDPNTTGSAKFSDDSTSKQITQTTNFTIKGVTESSKKDNIGLTATINSATKAKIKFSVLWVVLSLRYGNNLTISEDNAGKTTFVGLLGDANLGLRRGTPHPAAPSWVTAVEIVGNVLPSDFTGNITLTRRTDSLRVYSEKVVVRKGGGHGDTSDPTLRDDDPQSGMSNGKVYDLDAPGIGTAPTAPVGRINRDRTNFTQWAMFGNMKVSADLQWYTRTSIQKTAGGDEIVPTPGLWIINGYGNDNEAGIGVTPLTWDLGPERPSYPFGASAIDDSPTYVSWLYQDLLGREPEQSGVNAWMNVINQCGSAACVDSQRAFVARNFMFSSEFFNAHPELASAPFGSHAFNEHFVEQCYQVFLRRPSDQGGKAAWVAVMDNIAPNTTHADYDQLILGFINSTEYRVRFPGTNE